MSWIANPEVWIALVTLTVPEIVLGICFAMAFSVFVEMINLRVRAKAAPVQLRQAYVQGELTPSGFRPQATGSRPTMVE